MSRTINELPSDQRPREKLLKHGAEFLSNQELLAIFIRTGLPKRSALAIANELIEQEGSLTGLSQVDPSVLASYAGLGPAKAAQIKAAFELGARATREQLHKTPLNSSESIYAFLAPSLRSLRQESLRVLCVDTQLNFESNHELTRGSVNQTIAIIRDILHYPIARISHGFILIHNHPSGDPTPSTPDVTLTRKLWEASEMMGITFYDHIIIGREHDGKSPYYSFRDHNRLHPDISNI